MRPLIGGMLVGVLVLVSAACSDGGAPPAAPSASPSVSPGTSTAVPAGMEESLRSAALALVEARERSLIEGDRAAFMDTVDPRDDALVATQARWFDNLAALPATDISLDVAHTGSPTQMRGQGALRLPVDFTMRLDGFDREPVTQRRIYTFDRSVGGVVLVDDSTPPVDARAGRLPTPWDITRIERVRDGPLLGVFDEDTIAKADTVMEGLAAARESVLTFDPSWPGQVVAYVIDDPRAREAMNEGGTHDTGGVAFPVLVSPDSDRVAAHRLMVDPVGSGSSRADDYLYRHELVHVALGTRDDASPVWLVEGIAEHVARSVLSPAQRRRIATRELAGRGPRRLEPSARFYTNAPTRNYALAALVCDYLVDTRGPDVLIDLVDAYDRAAASSAPGMERVLRRRLGSGSTGLVRDALTWAGATS